MTTRHRRSDWHRVDWRRTDGLLVKLAMAALLALALLPRQAGAQVEKCTICHAKESLKKTLPSGQVVSLHVDENILARSSHKTLGCVDCHADVQEIPHTRAPDKVNCVRCHFGTNSAGAPTDVDYEAYKTSVHGRLAAGGDTRAPTCQSCHGSHLIVGKDDPRSQVARQNLPGTCGTCHLKVYTEYAESVHGQAVLSGDGVDAATCSDCHGEHNILEPDDPDSSTNTLHVGESCARCHEALPLMSKYGIEASQVETYEDTYHGVANKFGSLTAANCASCHGVHDIRGPDDPKSSVNKNNVAKTCGSCHEGTNANYTQGKMHVDAHDVESGIIFWVAQAFKWLTIGTMVALISHIFLDLNYRARVYRRRHGRRKHV